MKTAHRQVPVLMSERDAVWLGPTDSDPFAAFGPGTTKGGRAEAGWFEIGLIVGDGPSMTRQKEPQ